MKAKKLPKTFEEAIDQGFRVEEEESSACEGISTGKVIMRTKPSTHRVGKFNVENDDARCVVVLFRNERRYIKPRAWRRGKEF